MQTAQLLKLLKLSNVEASLIAVNAPYKPSFVRKIPIIRALFRLIPYLFKLWRSFKHYDVVHVMANSGWSFFLFVVPAIYIASLRQLPVIVNYRGGKAEQFFAKNKRLIQHVFAKVDRIIVPSKFLLEVFEKHDLEAQVVPNIIDLSIFSFQDKTPDIEKLHFIVTRNLEQIYDIASAIKALSILVTHYPKSKLTVAGTGPEESNLKQLVHDLKLSNNVTFVGRLSKNQIADLYFEADIMINPSTIDNMPNSLLEALASGVAVVSSNVGGIPFMVDNEKEALLVEPGDPQAIADSVIRLIDSPALLKSLRNNGVNRIKSFSPDRVLPMLIEHYDEVTEI
ncbi:glycosyltransferase family 4 protein [Thalassotalea montiporae]